MPPTPGSSQPRSPHAGEAQALIAPLREHAPFDEMDAASLRFLGQRLRLAYYPRGELVIGPESGPRDRLHIVKQGSVRGSGDGADVVLGPGELFPLGALFGRRATVYAYRADSDAFCWELNGDDFRVLLERSRRFRAFCTDHLAALVERSQRALRAGAAESALDGAGMLAPLRSAVRRAPVWCAPATPLREVLRAMHAAGVGSMLVVDDAGAPLGIFTTADVLAQVAAQSPMDTPIERLMSADPVALEEEATLADAALAMARHGIRHVVVTRDGKVTGVVSERDLFALQRVGLQRTAARIRSAQRLEDLGEAAADIRRLALQLLAQGVDAEPLTAMISALNDALTRRVIELTAARHELPQRWCWLALGSEGRMEQTFVTDQDNALIFGEGAAPLAFADEVNRSLDACGFPLCKGDIMARNPRWCLSAARWRAQFEAWIDNTDPQALMDAAIFFDFRPLAGEARLAGELREAVLERTKANRAFCRALAEGALQARPPLGLLAGFSADELDLKLLGARPFTDAARVLALAAGSAETGTAPRLRAAGESGAIEAFHYVQTLRLRGRGNRVRIDALSDIDRRVLKAAFRQGTLLQQRLRLDFGL
jgi:CBS domain-containing protein